MIKQPFPKLVEKLYGTVCLYSGGYLSQYALTLALKHQPNWAICHKQPVGGQ